MIQEVCQRGADEGCGCQQWDQLDEACDWDILLWKGDHLEEKPCLIIMELCRKVIVRVLESQGLTRSLSSDAALSSCQPGASLELVVISQSPLKAQCVSEVKHQCLHRAGGISMQQWGKARQSLNLQHILGREIYRKISHTKNLPLSTRVASCFRIVSESKQGKNSAQFFISVCLVTSWAIYNLELKAFTSKHK